MFECLQSLKGIIRKSVTASVQIWAHAPDAQHLLDGVPGNLPGQLDTKARLTLNPNKVIIKSSEFGESVRP